AWRSDEALPLGS
nr:Chain C, Integrin beta-3 [Homo sapiens]2Q6W_F Chain F, Integrin beta-3 [Homo sapiens]